MQISEENGIVLPAGPHNLGALCKLYEIIHKDNEKNSDNDSFANYLRSGLLCLGEHNAVKTAPYKRYLVVTLLTTTEEYNDSFCMC